MYRLMGIAILISGCACQTGVGITGHGDADDDSAEDGSVMDVATEFPIDVLGETGWRDSSTPWCEPREGEYHGFDIWADSRGVFLAQQVGWPSSDLEIYLNNGTGWRMWHESVVGASNVCIRHLTGEPDGSYLFGFGCKVASITPTTVNTTDLYAVHGHGVNEHLAYAVVEGDPRLYWWDGGSWGPYPGDPLPYPVAVVWANEDTVFVAGDGGVVLQDSGDGWTVHDTGTVQTIRNIFGFSGTDVWFSTMEGSVYHYDGMEWRLVPLPESVCCPPEHLWSPVHDMWGIDGTLFMITDCQVLMWNGSEVVSIGYWPHYRTEGPWSCFGGVSLAAIAGNAVDEVFLYAGGALSPDPACGYRFLLWWDGSEFHWF